MSRNDPSPALLWKPCPFLSVAVSGVGLYLQQHEQVPQRTLTHSTQASKSDSSASSLQISRVTFPVVTASQLSWQSFSTAAGSRSLLTLGFLSLSRIHKHNQKEKDRQRSLVACHLSSPAVGPEHRFTRGLRPCRSQSQSCCPPPPTLHVKPDTNRLQHRSQ